MKSDQLDFLITFQPHRQNGSSENLHSYKVLIDNNQQSSGQITEQKFVDIFQINFSTELSPGRHVIQVDYNNLESKGVLQISNIHIIGTGGGISLDHWLHNFSIVKYNSERIEKNRTGIWHRGIYQFEFESPFFYWLLNKFPIK